MSLQLRLKLPFEGGIVFSGFVPETKDDGLQLSLGDGNYCVTVYLADHGERLKLPSAAKLLAERVETRPAIKDLVIIDKLQSRVFMFEEVLRGSAPAVCTGLTMEIEVKESDPDVVKALEAGQPTNKTEEFGQQIFEVVVKTYNGLVSYFRNIAKQYWLESVAVRRPNCHWFLWSLDAEWLDSDGNWRRLISGPLGQHLGSMTDVAAGVDRSEWAGLPSFIIEQGGRAPMSDMLIANSFQHLSQQNGNMAVVEAVAALESAMKTTVSDVVKGLAGDAQTTRQRGATPKETEIENLIANLVDNVVKDTGLAVSAKIGLSMIRASLRSREKDVELTHGHIETVVQGIEERNRMMHGSRRRPVPVEKAQDYITAIRAAIATLEDWKAHMLR